jgi:hypothetical protein
MSRLNSWLQCERLGELDTQSQVVSQAEFVPFNSFSTVWAMLLPAVSGGGQRYECLVPEVDIKILYVWTKAD